MSTTYDSIVSWRKVHIGISSVGYEPCRFMVDMELLRINYGFPVVSAITWIRSANAPFSFIGPDIHTNITLIDKHKVEKIYYTITMQSN